MTCSGCKHEFWYAFSSTFLTARPFCLTRPFRLASSWQCMQPYTSDHFEDTMCTMYERSPAVFYIKAVGRLLFRRDSDSSDSSSSDDETLLQKLDQRLEATKEKLSDVKEDLSLRWDSTKEDLTDAFDNVAAAASEKLQRFKSFFTK